MVDSKKLALYLQFLFLKRLREGEATEDGEGKFGYVPLTLDPNTFLQSHTSFGQTFKEGLSPHPLLSKSQQFSGDDPKLTANPTENSNAQEIYPQLRQQNSLKYRKNRTPKLVK